ncbi:MAG: transposase [Bacteroidota bacterium]
MKKRRKTYDKAFKEMAVELLVSGKSCAEVSRELDVASSTLNRWRREFEADPQNRFPGKGNAHLSDQEREILRLKKALREAQLEAEILKKAVSIFSKGGTKSMNS